jgi:hypothetical protein
VRRAENESKKSILVKRRNAIEDFITITHIPLTPSESNAFPDPHKPSDWHISLHEA